MSEIQKTAIGLVGMSHPEIYRYRTSSVEQAPSAVDPPASKPAPAASALRGLKFAFAALLAGSRCIPLGDNGRIIRELGEYGTRLRGC
jgi:hypothetical protein